MAGKKDNSLNKKQKALLDKELNDLNEKVKKLGYKLSELLNLDCNFGVCSFDPEIDNVQEKIKEIEEKKKLLEFLKKNIDAYGKS